MTHEIQTHVAGSTEYKTQRQVKVIHINRYQGTDYFGGKWVGSGKGSHAGSFCMLHAAYVLNAALPDMGGGNVLCTFCESSY